MITYLKKIADNMTTADEQEEKVSVIRIRLIFGHIQLEIAS